MSGGPDLSQFSMLDLFRSELESQSVSLTQGLLALERDPVAADQLEACMRAAHSLKGASRIIDLEPAVRVADAMEDCFVAAQRGQIRLTPGHIDTLLKGVDLLGVIASSTAAAEGATAAIAEFRAALAAGVSVAPAAEPKVVEAQASERTAEPAPATAEAGDRMVRITADAMDHLLALAGESLLEARRLRPFADQLMRLKRSHNDLAKAFETLSSALPAAGKDDVVQLALAELRDKLVETRGGLADRVDDVVALDQRATDLANRLYGETLTSRMRPFEDGVRRYTRTVRDLARDLGKSAHLEIVGGSTGIDRDILDQLDAPLGHLLRNAIDHGLETPEERIAAGKPAEATIRLEARHNAGLLQIIVADDGRGIDLDQLRTAVLSRGMAPAEAVAALSETELLEFLFLPGFSMKATVSDISGRGVGLDAVQIMAKQVRGLVSVTTELGHGSQFQLQLPLTLSVLRTLLVEVAGELYAFPLAGITRTLNLSRDAVEVLEGKPHFRFGDQQIGLLTVHEILESGEAASDQAEMPVIVIGEGADAYGLIVDRFLGERELVVRPLDRRLAKIKDISAAALVEDGSPVLIIDTEDLIRSAEKLAATGRLRTVQRSAGQASRKRVLVVDDSLTVRELERKMLDQHGYDVSVAVDGMDAWNMVRSGGFDLIVTDVDMPRMDGIELVTLIKGDARLRNLPVLIVSYKDRAEDRRRGLDAGADYYLTKSSFHDEALIDAVADLIGAASA
jgi:two-component system sensor histidine kinase and response regulator WspE